ncbi:MAG: acyl-CoA dehydrogenase family protein [Candidatus Rokubacteria bacterium]|nr:acyl-CoA dehydrogenase family protein [Candidatus Rokubacteria bacterium]
MGPNAYQPSDAGREYVRRARELAPRIAAAGVEIDANRTLPAPIVDALHEAGLFRLLLPRSLGGAELEPLAFMSVMEEVAKADASTAWCLGQTNGCSMSAAYLEPGVAQEIFGDPRGVLAWGPGPGARAVAVEGGFRVSGTWSFASGGHLATWLGGYCPIVDADGAPRRTTDGRPAGRTMLFPAASVKLTDIWHVMGLRGTASDAYTAHDLFVPARYALRRDDASARTAVGPLYCFPINNLFMSGFSGVALGIARAMLDALIALAQDKKPRGFARPLRESAVAQSEVARCEARLSAARAFLVSSIGDVWAEVVRTGQLELDQRMRIRLASTYAIQEAKAAADVVYHTAGSTAIFGANPFERRFRDINTVTQQLQGRYTHFETVGQFLLGLEADISFL